jgi:uncharacterized protein
VHVAPRRPLRQPSSLDAPFARRVRGPRELLNEMKRTTGLAGVEVTYVHRGAPGDAKIVRADDITNLGRSFFTRRERGRETSIPYHRVLRIERRGATVWERRPAG